MSNDFTDMQERLYKLMADHPDTDVNIVTMWARVYGREEALTRSVRGMQQGLGPLIARINAKLDGHRIEPGRIKQTYRLSPK